MKARKPRIVSYAWKSGGGEFSKIDPQAAAEALEEIREQHGALKPALVVDVARAPLHPLHNAFPWDDAEAARLGREAVAARLIRSITVKIETPDRKEIDTRAFTSSPDAQAKGGRSYRPILEALDDAEERAIVLQRAWRELRAWRQRYNDLSELAHVFDAIDALPMPKPVAHGPVAIGGE